MIGRKRIKTPRDQYFMSTFGLTMVYVCMHACSMYVCVFVCKYVCILVKLHITAQSGPVIVVILCHSH